MLKRDPFISRSSSLVVPPSTPQSGTRRSSHSPGSRSLHLSPKHGSRENSGKGKRGSSASPVISGCPEMFTFPPVPDSAADSAPISSRLSSVLHVHDSNLSSDDFHEALFFDRSPKSAKKRRRSKKTAQPATPKRDCCHDDAKEAAPPTSAGSNKKAIRAQQQPSHICAH